MNIEQSSDNDKSGSGSPTLPQGSADDLTLSSDVQENRVVADVQSPGGVVVIELSLVEMWEGYLVWGPLSDDIPEPLLEFLDLAASFFEAMDVIRHRVIFSEHGANIKNEVDALRELGLAMAKVSAEIGEYQEILVS